MAGTKPRVTITDVAAASGVSRATVSFVLRDSPGQTISAATRERVRRTARDLGYVPHAIARALRELIDSPSLRAELARRSFDRVQMFSWSRCASETFGFLARVARR